MRSISLSASTTNWTVQEGDRFWRVYWKERDGARMAESSFSSLAVKLVAGDRVIRCPRNWILA